jgi:hypothetical protein
MWSTRTAKEAERAALTVRNCMSSEMVVAAPAVTESGPAVVPASSGMSLM